MTPFGDVETGLVLLYQSCFVQRNHGDHHKEYIRDNGHAVQCAAAGRRLPALSSRAERQRRSIAITSRRCAAR